MKVVSSLVLLASAIAPLSGAEMFYTQRGASTLSTAKLDGTSVQSLIPSAGSNIRGVAIDTTSDDLFYADNGADIIYRSRLDGTGRVTIVSGLGFPADIALDRAAGKVYWCDRNENRIEYANYDGTGRQTLISTTQPYYLDLDLTNGRIYWGDFSGGNIFSADLATGLDQQTFVDSNIQTRGVKVDPSGGYVYWCDRESHKVQRRTIAGGPIEDLYTGLDTPHGMTLDIPAGKVYWVDTGTNNVFGSIGANAVSRGSMDGSGPHEVLTAASGPWDITLDTRTTTYAEWVQRQFPTDLPAAQMLPSADADADGHTNLVEYFTGLDPLAIQRAQPIDTLPAAGEIRTLYRRTHSPITDVTAAVEFSADLITWQAGPATSEPVSIGASFEAPFTQIIIERPIAPLTDAGTVHARLHLTLAPK